MKHPLFPPLNEIRSYTQVIQLEREIGGLLCNFEVGVRRWTDDARYPEIDCVSAIEAFDRGGHQVRNIVTLNMLSVIMHTYCREHIYDIIDAIEKKGRE